MKKRLRKNVLQLVDDKQAKAQLVYEDGFFLLGQTWRQLEEQIAADCGLSVRTVQRHLDLAEERGWIKRLETKDGVGIKFTAPEMLGAP
jgi:hypothetical protein